MISSTENPAFLHFPLENYNHNALNTPRFAPASCRLGIINSLRYNAKTHQISGIGSRAR
jgi:hypothetical protein